MKYVLTVLLVIYSVLLFSHYADANPNAGPYSRKWVKNPVGWYIFNDKVKVVYLDKGKQMCQNIKHKKGFVYATKPYPCSQANSGK